MINVKLCVMVALTQSYLFIPFSVTLTFQGRSGVETVTKNQGSMFGKIVFSPVQTLYCLLKSYRLIHAHND